MDKLTPEQRSDLMGRVRNRGTTPELLVRGLVYSWGYRYRLHVKTLPGSPDLVFPSRRKVIFVHGCFWHQHRCKRGTRPATNTDFWNAKLERNTLRDKEAVRLLRNDGWRVAVIWECEVKNTERLTKRLRRFLSKE